MENKTANQRAEVSISTRQAFGHFLLAPLLLFFLLLLSYINFGRMADAVQRRRQSYEILLDSSRMRNSLTEMQTAVRGFVATRDESLLAPFERGAQNFQTALTDLQQALADDRQGEKLDFLARQEIRWRAAQRAVIAMRRRTLDDALALKQFARNHAERRKIMDGMQAVLSEIDRAESAVVQRQTLEEERLKKLMAASLFGGGVISVFLAAYLAMMVSRALRDLQTSNRALQNEIAERRRAEMALRDNERRFRAIFNNAFQFTGLLSPDGTLLETNQTALDFGGLRHEDVVGRPFWEAHWWQISSSTQQQLREAIEKAARGEFVRYETRVRGAGDATAIIDFSLKPVFDDDGAVVLLIPEGRDITEQRETQRKLSEIHERWKSVFESSLDSIVYSDLSGQLLEFNQAYCHLTQYSREELHALRYQEITPTEYHETEAKIVAQVQATGQASTYEKEYLRKDGSRVPVELTIFVVWDGATPRGMAAVVKDISERRRSEQALQESQRALSTLMNNLPGMAYRCMNQPEWPMIFVSDGCLLLTGYTPQEMEVGGELTFYDLMHPDDRDKVWKTVQESIENRRPYEIVYRIYTRSGEEKWVWEQGQAVRDERGKIRALEGLVLDITERRRAEETRSQLLDELRRSNRELEEFAYVASHDLQEPLRAVSGCVQILQRRYISHLDERAEELMRHAVEGSQRMQTLINDLLAYSRVGTRGKALEPTDCNRVLDSVLRTLRPAIEESGAHIERAELPHVMADAHQLEQVFQNLLSNALKFRGDEVPRIEIGAKRVEGEWIFHVRDHGIGIAPEYSERIFVMFQRLHTRAEYPGTGIGLAICKKIVERHGGRIWIESEVGQGTTFSFSIPGSLSALVSKTVVDDKDDKSADAETAESLPRTL